ncbi:uncharacterized protein LOC133502647 [Syngnathoides biaculeatus]|uniref:uncharacterized protein LOC133502647 n=1 Tax=Syngnathoides biaculeatus TaxID=300417 RepID=UPI002ADE8FEF|nr:uncharacterized protein LOC133502647 [Syngnathoides biaculeatus]
MGDLFVGKPAVVFSVFLTPEQLEWYKLADPSDPSMPPCHPHVSLMVSPQHTAKDHGPFVLTCTEARDWQNLFHSQLLYSSSLAYWIQSNTFLPTSVLEHQLLDKHHGRETTDSDFFTPTLPVPNPHSTLSQITSPHTHFTCIDLANAFFCIPLHPSMRQFFPFTWNGVCYSYNCLPQGFVLSPGLFNNCLRQLLSLLELPNGVLPVQYVDDLLLAALSETSCLEVTGRVFALSFGLCWPEVFQVQTSDCLATGFLFQTIDLTPCTGISRSYKDDILHHPKPMNVKTMLAFLGLCNNSRHHVPDFADGK